ncbi:hypothetical protein TRFO_16170 [Tritrichomonas foetus]|uniref:Uncharacterized protein n=1 Tax=Tritrichomonas foetus TaxID=1144522 RepID=A0A1J4KQS6_9EUKA|nr:hypothetical protein TRFO_16170 [Tritrichomonas foetus]|eukprot:OHT13623.1 hypothetical protein TRFO_16170 [Tritrichomonas foetus]
MMSQIMKCFFFFIFSSVSTEMDLIKEYSIILNHGAIHSHFFKASKGLIIFRNWDNVAVTYDTHLQTMSNYSIGGPITNTPNIIGIFLANYFGMVYFKGIQKTNVSFSVVFFPDECETIYISNARKSYINLSPFKDLNNNMKLCFYNAASSPINYKIKYNFGNNQNNNLTFLSSATNEVILTNKGEITVNYAEASILFLQTSTISLENYLSIEMNAPKYDQPSSIYTGYLSTGKPYFIIGEDTLLAFSPHLVLIVVSATIASVLLLSYYIAHFCCKVQKMKIIRENDLLNQDQISNSSEEQLENINFNRNAIVSDNISTINSVRRISTPTHINIRMIHSDNKSDSSESSTSSSTIAKVQKELQNNRDNVPVYWESNNYGYPQNEYHHPTYGIIPPSNLYNFDSNDDFDDKVQEISPKEFKFLSNDDHDSNIPYFHSGNSFLNEYSCSQEDEEET